VHGFYATMRGEHAPWVATFADGLRAVQLTEAILRSSQSRRWVELSPATTQLS
jgi:predicted dehydrogenase